MSITRLLFELLQILLRKFDSLSRKEIKMIKAQILWWKTTTKMQNIWKQKVVCTKQHSLFWTRPTNPWWNSQTLERRRKYNWSEVVSGTRSRRVKYNDLLELHKRYRFTSAGKFFPPSLLAANFDLKDI